MNEIESTCPKCGNITLVEIDENTDNWVDCEECLFFYSASTPEG